MGICIEAAGDIDFRPTPLGVIVTLECDAVTEFFCRGFDRFDHPDGFVGAHAQAMKAGWLERQTDKGRTWLCPACSGK
jgi:hypothetical protein